MKGAKYKTGETIQTHNGNKYKVIGLNNFTEYNAVHVEAVNGMSYVIQEGTIDHESSAKINIKSPKELLEDGFRVEYRSGEVRFALVKTSSLHDSNGRCLADLKSFNQNLEHKSYDENDIMNMYDRQDNLVWKREEKSEQQIKIEELQKTIDLAKKQIEELKGV